MEAGEHGTLVLVMSCTGIRWAEAIGLRVKDLDMLRRRINVTANAIEVGDAVFVGTPKSHKRRSGPFPNRMSTLPARACEGKGPDDLVFAGKHGTHLRRVWNDQGWFGFAARCPALERLTSHDGRRTAASLAVHSGANVKAVQRMLGHASASMTLDIYTDVFEDDLDAVAGPAQRGDLEHDSG